MSLSLLPCSLTHHWPSGKTWNKSIGPYFSPAGSWEGGGWEVIWLKHCSHKILEAKHHTLSLNEDGHINVSAGPQEDDVHTDTSISCDQHPTTLLVGCSYFLYQYYNFLSFKKNFKPHFLLQYTHFCALGVWSKKQCFREVAAQWVQSFTRIRQMSSKDLLYIIVSFVNNILFT